MKSMTKTMVIALFVLLTLAIVPAPVAARTANNSVIAIGDTIFVYETGLDVSALSATITSLRHYSDFTAGTVDNTISVGNPTGFDVLSSDVAGIYGTYYAWNAGGLVAGSYVDIKLPSATVDVVLNTSHVDSVNGKSITRASPIAFKIQSNVPAGFTVAKPNLTVELTTPDGGKITTFGTVAMARVPMTASQIYTDFVVGANDLTSVSPGTYTALAKWPSDSPFYKQGVDSNTVSFTVISKTVSIQANKESVVRGNNFVVTIQGESNKRYWVYIEDAGVGASQYPLILDAQSGISNTFPVVGLDAAVNDEAGIAGTEANVTTTAAGTRPIEFNTTPATKDKSFTIKVVDPLDTSKNDNVKVTVEKGKVTITAAGTGTYFLGEELTLTGTCTENKTNVHLFMTGPNLATNGVNLVTVAAVVNNSAGTFTTADVNTDNTWEYKWDTSAITGTIPDAGTYNVYAVAAPFDKNAISLSEYATVSVVFKKPFITGTVSSSTLAKGDKLVISGVAEGKPTNVYIWVFGKNYRDLSQSANVESDGKYSKTYERGTTSSLAAGQYYAIIQHPMINGVQDVFRSGNTNRINNTWSTDSIDLGGLQASDAATALIDQINSPNSDDTYTKLAFLVEEPWINIDTVGDKYVADKFTITGTTNLAEGDTILIEVVSAAFQPTDKTGSGEFSGANGQVTVVKGATANTWSFEIDAATFKPDQYIVKLEWVEGSGTTATTTFNVLERPATTVTTVPPVTTATTVTATTTATATATTTAAPTQPGFGALVALVGLGAVAFLVLRRR